MGAESGSNIADRRPASFDIKSEDYEMKASIICCGLVTVACLVGCGPEPGPTYKSAQVEIGSVGGGGTATDLYNAKRKTGSFHLELNAADGKTYRVEWQYVGTTELGDVYTILLSVPDAPEGAERGRAIIYRGAELPLYEDKERYIVIKPGKDSI